MSAPAVRVEKRFGHPVERVFDAFVDPARVGGWLFATSDGVMEKTDYDPRPGGTFAIFERREGGVAHHEGRFVTIERPRRIVFEFWVDEAPDEATTVTVDFRPDGNDCIVVLSHDLASAWIHYKDRTVQGWTTILDSLERVMETDQ